jgi:hypothetical protein
VRTACHEGHKDIRKTNYWVFQISNFGDSSYMQCYTESNDFRSRYCDEWKVEHYGGSVPFPDFVVENLHCAWENHAPCMRTTVAMSEYFYTQLVRYRPLIGSPPGDPAGTGRTAGRAARADQYRHPGAPPNRKGRHLRTHEL